MLNLDSAHSVPLATASIHLHGVVEVLTIHFFLSVMAMISKFVCSVIREGYLQACQQHVIPAMPVIIRVLLNRIIRQPLFQRFATNVTASTPDGNLLSLIITSFHLHWDMMPSSVMPVIPREFMQVYRLIVITVTRVTTMPV
jgi:hypothetical protein